MDMAVDTKKVVSSMGWGSRADRLHSRIALPLFLMSLLLLGACSPHAEDRNSAPPWHITVGVSGGFAGLVQNFEADSATGQLSASDERRRIRTSRPLTQSETQNLDRLIWRANSSVSNAPSPALACGDCITYELGLRSAQQAQVLQYNSLNVAASPHADLINALVSMGQDTLAKVEMPH